MVNNLVKDQKSFIEIGHNYFDIRYLDGISVFPVNMHMSALYASYTNVSYHDNSKAFKFLVWWVVKLLTFDIIFVYM